MKDTNYIPVLRVVWETLLLGRQVTGQEEVFIDGLKDVVNDEGAIDDTRDIEGFMDDSMDEGLKEDTKDGDESIIDDFKDEEARDGRFMDDVKDVGFLDDTMDVTMEKVLRGDE